MALVRSIADYRPPTGMEPGVYNLRDEVLVAEYDPVRMEC
jgi:hypothetical protein